MKNMQKSSEVTGNKVTFLHDVFLSCKDRFFVFPASRINLCKMQKFSLPLAWKYRIKLVTL